MTSNATDASATPTPDWARFREYLRFLADVQLGGQLRTKIDPSDLVQQTLLQAHMAQDQCRAENSAGQAAWLRQVLNRNLLHAARDLQRDKRDVRRERSLQAVLNESSCRIERFLAADESTPDVRAERNEQISHLAVALAKLPEAQRDAIVAHYWQGRSLSEVGEQLGRSAPAVAGLIHRGLKALKATLRNDSLPVSE